MTTEEMAREVYDLWAHHDHQDEPTIEDCCYDLHSDLPGVPFLDVMDRAYELADEEAFGLVGELQ